MDDSIEFISPVIQGKFEPHVTQSIKQALTGMEGKRIHLKLSEYRKNRSLHQNAYWFAVLDKHIVKPCRKEGSNLSSYKLHCEMMTELGYEEATVFPDGSVKRHRMESKKFTTKQWEEYMERARAYIAERYNIYIPEPNEEISVFNMRALPV